MNYKGMEDTMSGIMKEMTRHTAVPSMKENSAPQGGRYACRSYPGQGFVYSLYKELF